MDTWKRLVERQQNKQLQRAALLRITREYQLQPVQQAAVRTTGLVLTSATGMLALVLAAQRRQRVCFAAFLLLLLASAYSPLLISWEADHAAQVIDSNGVVSLELGEYVLFPAVVALVALVVAANPNSGLGRQPTSRKVGPPRRHCSRADEQGRRARRCSRTTRSQPSSQRRERPRAL